MKCALNIYSAPKKGNRNIFGENSILPVVNDNTSLLPGILCICFVFAVRLDDWWRFGGFVQATKQENQHKCWAIRLAVSWPNVFKAIVLYKFVLSDYYEHTDGTLSWIWRTRPRDGEMEKNRHFRFVMERTA